MGEKTDSKNASSPYAVLENRPLDQWKVTELKDELKKRKLVTRGLKEELVKRLDEAVRADMDDATKNLENDSKSLAEPEVQSDDAEEPTDVIDQTENKNVGLDKDDIVDELDTKNDDNTDDGLPEKMVTEGEGDIVSTRVESIKVVQEISVETTVVVSEESQMVEKQNKYEGSNGELKSEPQSPEEERAKVDEVSQESDYIFIDKISNTEKNELKDDTIADDVKLEIDVKPEMAVDGSKSELIEVDEKQKVEIPAEKKDVNNDETADDVKLEPPKSIEVEESLIETITTEEKSVIDAEDVEICKKNDSGDVGSSEKLNLDRSSGDDSMEEDVLESKQIDSKFSSDEVVDKSEKMEIPIVKEDDSVDVMVEDATADKEKTPIEDKTGPSVASTKRKPHDQEAAENTEIVKRQRRWNSENVKVPEQQSANLSASTTPKDAFQSLAKRTFSRSELTLSQESPKERVVSPSSKAPTTSLRIDHFLRPFTLKAVQELLGKTGTVVSFWMDQIKTHCYVTYAFVEEAIETRNAVCNLQWPVNGGRLLMPDFVDPQEVKNRVDPPPPSPVTAIPPATMQSPQPSPRLKQQQLPPPPALPPPPPLSNPNPPPARNRTLPPPPPPQEKTEPPIVTLDDLFKKTRATPRIYYLPLSNEQVAEKLNAQGKPMML